MRPQATENQIMHELARLLDCHLDFRSLDKSFHELGVDSLVGIRLIGQLADAIGHEIDPSIVFDYPSIRELADYLEQNFVGLDITEPLAS